LSQETVLEESIKDGTSFSGRYCDDSTPPSMGLLTAQVNASAIPGAVWVGLWVSGEPFSEPISGTSIVSFNQQFPVGTLDVFVVAYDITSQIPLAVKILRSQTIPGALNGGNPIVFTTSDETTTQTITYDNVPSGFTTYSSSVDFFTSNGELPLETAYSVTPSYLALPAAALETGDYYTFNATDAGGTSSGPVSVELATSSGGPQTLTFAAPWEYSGPTAANLPTFNFNYSGFSGMTSVVETAYIQWGQGTTAANGIAVSASQNYQNGATSITIPDLTGLTGFLAPAPSGTTVLWDANIAQGAAFQTTPPNGVVQTATEGGTYTEP
jgi:hypothetical protein